VLDEYDKYEFNKHYKEEFEKLFRKFCDIKDKKSIWLKEEK